MNNKKKVDAVKLTRKIRDKLSKQYYGNTEQLYKDMESIKNKYLIKENSETYKKQ